MKPCINRYCWSILMHVQFYAVPGIYIDEMSQISICNMPLTGFWVQDGPSEVNLTQPLKCKGMCELAEPASLPRNVHEHDWDASVFTHAYTYNKHRLHGYTCTKQVSRMHIHSMRACTHYWISPSPQLQEHSKMFTRDGSYIYWSLIVFVQALVVVRTIGKGT